MTQTNNPVDAERPGCRICGEQDYHIPLCPFWIDRFSEPSPVLDSERKDFGRMAQATAESKPAILPMSQTDYLLSHLAQECCEIAVRCTLCDKGFPINEHGEHYGTQSLGMIPSRRCEKLPEDAEKAERVHRPRKTASTRRIVIDLNRN